MKHSKILTTVSTLVLAATMATPALAQVDDEIIVTATKRAEGIQDVPVSVSAVTPETIGKLGAVDISDLAVYLPNFETNNSTILPNLYVRGLGSGATHSIEQSVGQYTDEVYAGRGALSIHGFFDIAGVELLRGPQGTLFGKNTVAGAMIVRTADPTDELEAGVDLTYGGYSTRGDYKEAQAFVSGSIADGPNGGLRARLAGRYRQNDGYYINRLNDPLLPGGPDREDFGIRLKLEWDVGPNTLMSAKLEHQKIDMIGQDAPEVNAVGGPPSYLANLIALSPGFNTDLDWEVDMNCGNVSAAGRDFGSFCPGRDQDTSTATFRIDHDFDGVGTLTSLSAFQTYEFEHKFWGIDQGLANSFRAYRDENYNSFTQEVRFTSDLVNDKFDYIVGAYYENSDVERIQRSDVQFFVGGLGPIALQRNEPWSQDTETIAAFAQVRYNLTDRIRAILGGRYANETKDYTFNRFFDEYDSDLPLTTSPTGPFGDPTPLTASDDRSESKFTPAITLQYEATDDVNVYATYSQGHKTGGFSERIDGPGADFEFDPETNDNFELGMKGRFLDGRLKANLALFHMSVSGLQLATQVDPNAPIFSVDNAAEVTSKGLEFDAVLDVTDSLSVGVDYAYTDATYDDFLGAPACPAANVNAAGQCDLSGFVLNFAPKHKGNAFIEYFNDSAFGDWGFGARANAAISGEYFTDISYADASFEDGYTIIGGSIRLVSPDEKYTLSLVGKNLTEEVVLQWGIPSGPNSLASLRAPREVAVRLGARF